MAVNCYILSLVYFVLFFVHLNNSGTLLQSRLSEVALVHTQKVLQTIAWYVFTVKFHYKL